MKKVAKEPWPGDSYLNNSSLSFFFYHVFFNTFIRLVFFFVFLMKVFFCVLQMLIGIINNRPKSNGLFVNCAT